MDNMNEQGYQPQDYSRQEVPPLKPNSNLFLAIFTTLCCCLPFGIVAIVKSTKVDSFYNMRQYQAAQNAADEAKKWSLIGIGIGAVISIIYAIIYVIYGVAIYSQV